MFPLIPILFAVILVGAALAIWRLLPIDPTFKQIGYIIIVVAFCLYLLSMFTGYSFGPGYRR